MVNELFKLHKSGLAIALAAIFLICFDSAAQAERFYSRISPQAGATDDRFILSLTLEDAEPTHKPTLAESPDFEIQEIGPQTSISIINGKVSRSITWTFALYPKKAGNLQTPAVDLQLGPKILHAESISVKVTASDAPPANSQQNTQETRSQGAFLTQSLDPSSEIFVGQQVVHTLTLNTAINLYEPIAPDFTFDGFLAKKIADNERSTTLNRGQQYDVLRFRRALYALKAGEMEIAPKVVKAKIREEQRGSAFDNFDPFDLSVFNNFFGGGQLKNVEIKSNALKIAVKPLPAVPNNLPSWGLSSPIVGETTVELHADSAAIKVGETKTITVKITSTGNISGIKSIEHKFPATVQVYQESPETKEFESGGLLVTQKTFKLSLVPIESGKIDFPALELGYFDLTELKYRLASSHGFSFEVDGPKQAEKSVSNISEAKDEKSTVSDKLPESLSYREKSWLDNLSDSISLSFALFVVTVVIVFILIFWGLVRTFTNTKAARADIKAIAESSSLNELIRCLKFALHKRFSIDPDLRGPALRIGLKQQALTDQAIFELEKLLDELDALNYSGTSHSSINFNEFKNKTLKLEVLKQY